MHDKLYLMNDSDRRVVLSTIQQVCLHRGWALLVCHVRSNHVHVVVEAEIKPETAMNTFKAYASRALRENVSDDRNPRRWARHGSTKYLFTRDEVDNAISYVADHQGTPMALYVADNLR